MENWKVYEITSISLGSDRIKFELNDWVSYRDGGERWIFCKNEHPLNDFKVGDQIEIDEIQTVGRGKIYLFWPRCDVRKAASSDLIKILKSKISELESSSSTQLVLRKNTENDLSIVRAGINSLQIEKRNLEENNQSLRSQLVQRNRDIQWGINKLAEKETKVDELTAQFTDLQIENDRNKDKIKELKNELGQSREGYLNQKIELKEEKLEILAQQLGINWGQITNLRNAYRQLIDAQGNNFNPTNINTANDNINNIKAALSNVGVNPTDKKKVCHKCKKITELEMELSQVYQQQYEARQEVPPRNN